jgi:PAS domain S-box-containing protein
LRLCFPLKDESEEVLDAFIDASFDAMILINDTGNTVKVNKAATDAFGWTKEKVLGQMINIIMEEEHGNNHDQYMARFFETGEKQVIGKSRELTAKKQDGNTFPESWG